MVRAYHQFCDLFWSLTGLITDQCLLFDGRIEAVFLCITSWPGPH